MYFSKLIPHRFGFFSFHQYLGVCDLLTFKKLSILKVLLHGYLQHLQSIFFYHVSNILYHMILICLILYFGFIIEIFVQHWSILLKLQTPFLVESFLKTILGFINCLLRIQSILGLHVHQKLQNNVLKNVIDVDFWDLIQ